MSVYYSLFVLTLLLSFILPAKTDKQWHRKLFCTFLPLFLFGALRVNFGNDYLAYEHIYNVNHYVSNFRYDKTAHAEYGFQLLCYLLPSYRSLLVLNSFLLCLGLAVFINRNVPRKLLWLAVILIFLNVEKNIYGSLVGTRTGYAVAVFLLGSIYIQRRNALAFTLVTLLSMSFHSASLFFMPLAYLIGRNKEIDKKEIVMWLVLAGGAVLLSFSRFKTIVEPFLIDQYESYKNYLKVEAHRGWLLTASGLILFYLSFVVFWSNRKEFDCNHNSLIRMGLLYIVTTLLGSMAFRAGYFYDMFFIGTVVSLVHVSTKNRALSYFLCILAIIMSTYSFVLWRSANYGNIRYDVYQSIIGELL